MLRCRALPSPRLSKTAIAFALALGATACDAADQAAAAPHVGYETGQVQSITDGDTFRLTTGERLRIADIDAPETQTGQAHCSSEIAQGQIAAAQLRQMLLGRQIEFQRVGQSYNRTVARIRFAGRDLSEFLIERGIAEAWPHGTSKPDWCD